MAIRKCQLVKTENGTRTTMYLETGSEVVKRPDGQTVEAALASLDANKSPMSHTHTYRTTDIKRPNGVTTETALTNLENGKAPMIHTHNDTVASGDSYKIERVHFGAPIYWGGKYWVILHIDGRILTLGACFIADGGQWNANNYAPMGYASSFVREHLGTYEAGIPRDSLDMAVDTTKAGVTAKIFTLTYADLSISVHPYLYDPNHRSLFWNDPYRHYPDSDMVYEICNPYWLADAWPGETFPVYVGTPPTSGSLLTPGAVNQATTADVRAAYRPFVRIRL